MEDKTETLIRGRVKKGIYKRCFHPMRHVRKKFRGEWKDLHEKLLPGYVFIVSDSVEALYKELKQVPMLTKMLGKEGEWFAALRMSEVDWLERLMDSADRGKGEEAASEIGLSQIVIEGDRVVILSGPLKHVEGEIKKFHLHRRMAEVEVEFMGRKTVIHLGIEMVEKREKKE